MNKVRLSSIIDIISGGTPKTDVKEYWLNGTIGWLSVTDFNNDLRYVYTSEKNITELGLKNSNTKLLNKGDIILSARGTVGALAQIGTPMCFNQSCFGLRGRKGKVETDFLYYALKNYVHNIKKRSQGSVFDTINLNSFDLMEIEIPLEMEIQQKIASVLSALDSKIELNNRINAELEAMAKTLYDYWFVQFDFPDAAGKPYKANGGKMVWSKKLKREIPEGWEVKPLSMITAVSNESINPMYFPDKEFKHYSIPGFDEFGTFLIEKGIEIKSNKYTINSSDVLVSKLNPWFNRVVYATDDTELISSTEFVVWRAENIAIKNYLYMIAQDASFVVFCTKSASGTSNSHKRVNPAVMMNYHVAFNNTIATLYGNKLGASINMLAKNQIENQKLTELRDWLLPMLMNGQVKVKDEKEPTIAKAAEQKMKYGK